ncbi:hypothetical protein ES708_33216 [subsurface metagenome]
MAINTSVNFKSIGTWIHEGQDITVMRLNYIDLNVTYEYIFTLGDVEFYGQGGGYVGYAVNGKTIYKPEDGDKDEDKIDIGTSDEDEIKPIDGGFIIGAGVYFGKIKLGLAFHHGLANVSNIGDWTARHRAGVANFTYFFNR